MLHFSQFVHHYVSWQKSDVVKDLRDHKDKSQESQYNKFKAHGSSRRKNSQAAYKQVEDTSWDNNMIMTDWLPELLLAASAIDSNTHVYI